MRKNYEAVSFLTTAFLRMGDERTSDLVRAGVRTARKKKGSEVFCVILRRVDSATVH